MSDLIVSYKGNTIIDLSESGNKTIKTSGKYCEADLLLQYAKPSGGGAFILIKSTVGATLTCGEQTYTLGSDETEHAFAVSLGTYICTASNGTTTKSETVVVSEETVYSVELTLGRLPVEFQEVEFIEVTNSDASASTLYTGLDFLPYFEFIAYLRQSATHVFFGQATPTTGANIYRVERISPSNPCWNMYGHATDIPITQRHSISYRGDKLYVDNVFSDSFTIPSRQSPLFLFNNDPASVWPVVLEQLKFYDMADNLVRDFVCCYRKADNKIGLFDLHEYTFYPIAFDGVIVGPDVI